MNGAKWPDFCKLIWWKQLVDEVLMEEMIQETLAKAVELHKAGEFDLAGPLYEAVIKLQPDHADANHNMGLLKLDTGQYLDALPFLQTALQADSTITQFWISYIKALIKLDRRSDAARILHLAEESGMQSEEFPELESLLRPQTRSTTNDKVHVETTSHAPDNIQNPEQETINRLIKLYEKQRFAVVVEEATKIIKQYPNSFAIWNILGAAQSKLGRLFEASQAFKNVTELNPEFIDGFKNLGITLQKQGKLDEAITAFKKAVLLKSDYLEVHNSLGVLYKQQQKSEDAIKAFKKVISLSANFFEAYNNLGVILHEKEQFKEAIEMFRKAISIEPKYAESYNNWGVALQAQGKSEAALEKFQKAISLKINYPEALNNLGSLLRNQGQLEAAVKALKKALSLKPDYAEAYFNLGNAFADQNRLAEATTAYDKAVTLRQNYHEALAQKLRHQAYICDWAEKNVNSLFVAKLDFSGQPIPPFFALSLEDNPERHHLRAKAYVGKNYQNYKPIAAFIRPSRLPSCLHIAYFSSDFRAHPVTFLMSRIIDCHNRDSFKVYGYSLGPPVMDEMRAKLSQSFDTFRDLHELNDTQIAKIAHEDKIDIAIDLTGYTLNNRSGIFALRPAPIQLNYLGYPGSMGADFMDYIIADQNLIPVESQKYYTEKPIYLPHQYQAQDDKLEIARELPTRTSLGLPEKGFVFCAINNTYKVTPNEFDIWMRLLHKVRGSVLWLLESNKWAKENLTKEAIARGIKPNRLVFAKRVEHEKYLAQFCLADLYLDTFNYNAGATASNALWAGLPVLTKRGKSYTARMASSLLISIGLSELVTDSEAQYESLALELAQNIEQLNLVRQKLANNKMTMPLFNTKLFTKHLENGYQQAYQRYLSGKEPDVIFVPE